MFTSDICGLPVKTQVEVRCDCCDAVFVRTIEYTKRSRKVRSSDEDLCNVCSRARAAQKRPQNSKEFWDTQRTTEEYQAKYYEGIENRPSITGASNPMWGKTFSPESKAIRAEIWRQRTGENATNWKGGKLSLNRRIKSALQRRHGWFSRVIARDGCCQRCNSTNRLDAHHITPLKQIIDQLLIHTESLTESEKFDWLIVQPEIVDENLLNGVTLCRTCHKRVHLNWGSHEPKV